MNAILHDSDSPSLSSHPSTFATNKRNKAMSVTFRGGHTSSLVSQPCKVTLDRPDITHPRATQTVAPPAPPNFASVLRWLACLLAGEPAHLWVTAGTKDGGTTELRIMAWLWATLGPLHVSIAVSPNNVEPEDAQEGRRVVILRQCSIRDSLPDPCQGTVFLHVATGLPVNPLPWTSVCFVRRSEDVPVAPPSEELPVVAAWLEACLPTDGRMLDSDRPCHMAFWRGLPRWHAPPEDVGGSVQSAQTDRCTEALHILRSICAISPSLRMPLKELHAAFRDAAPDWWVCPVSSQAWARDPAVVEALNMLGCTVGVRAENRIWPRGQTRRRHSVFVHGIDLLVI